MYMAHHPHLDYLHIVDLTQSSVYIQSLTTVSASQHFGSVVRPLDLYRYDPGSIPSQGAGTFSAMLYTCCSFHVLMKKVNKQCLLDTPRTVRVSEKNKCFFAK